MQSIQFNRENHPVLMQLFDIFAELSNHEKYITLCKVLAHFGIKDNEASDKAAK